MPEEKKDYGKLLLAWEFEEKILKERNKAWYILASIIGLIVLIWCIRTQNFLFAIIILVAGIVIVLEALRGPQKMKFKIYEDWVMINDVFDEFDKFKNFAIVYKPPKVKRLYLSYKTQLKPELSIPLEQQNPLKVRKILKQYLEEDTEREEESFTDVARKTLKL